MWIYPLSFRRKLLLCCGFMRVSVNTEVVRHMFRLVVFL